MTTIKKQLEKMGGWRLGFLSQAESQSIDALEVVGQVPEWLHGAFISTGPAVFELDGQYVDHWFQGLGMLKGFYFNAGQVGFKNKMLQSDTYKHYVLGEPEGPEYDDGNVTVFPFGDKGSAMTESLGDCSFDPKSLETIGHIVYQGELDVHLTLAHLVVDPVSGHYINVGIQFGPTTRYLIYTIDTVSSKQEVIAAYESSLPFYMHSFSVTNRYIVLFQSPLIFDVEALMSGGGFTEMLTKAEGAPTQFIVIDRETGTSTAIFHEESMCFHQVNAIESADVIVVDSCDVDRIDGFADGLFELLCNPDYQVIPAYLKRHTIDLQSNSVSTVQLTAAALEFPRINDAYAALDYQYVYAALTERSHNFFDGLIKVDVEQKKDVKYYRDNCYFGEPIFVAHPDTPTEDDGVVMSLAFDAVKNQSLLVVLDAQSFTELAHAYIPIPIPFGLHGHWFAT
ncbi:MAG: carotenoid oxygenase family protein [Halioglobus sp.]|nr:carotenoid oxygenase family protein [Halioglobus sp.]